MFLETEVGVSLANDFGGIGRKRINNDDFVGHRHNGIKAALDVSLLVEGDDDDRKGVH